MNTSTAIIFGTFDFICGVILAGYARADEIQIAQIQNPSQYELTAEKVRAYLYLSGFEKEPPPLPTIYTVDLRGYAGLTVAGAIIVSSREPEDCAPIIVAHEYAHFILGKVYGFGPKKSERIAREVERVVSTSFQPNCEAPL